MKITVFKELTTLDYINELVKESESWVGFYVDMEDKEQRKFVKDKADEINQLLKKIDRRRIDAAKESKLEIESQAKFIREKLEAANSHFTLLIEAHKAERKKILDAEKARKEAIEAAHQYEIDHEFALLMNDKFDADKIAELAAQEKRDNELRAQAIEQQKQANIQAEENARLAAIEAEEKRVRDVEQAKQAEIQKQADEAKRVEDERLKREANTAHLAKINNEILHDLESFSIDSGTAKHIIKLIAAGHISHVKINY